MPRPPRKSFEGAKYHIAVRGNGRQDIFLSDEDRRRFLDQLKDAAEKDGVRVYAYVLMSNHYHLLIETRRANVSAFMQRLNTAYGMYFRHKHKRPGGDEAVCQAFDCRADMLRHHGKRAGVAKSRLKTGHGVTSQYIRNGIDAGK
jgi:REP element-mobilizing transposase RayT